jgi:hypothetical protein
MTRALAARHNGFPFTDVTPDLPDQSHRDEVLKWLEHHPDVTRYAVLDDTKDCFEELPLCQTDAVMVSLMIFPTGEAVSDRRDR